MPDCRTHSKLLYDLIALLPLELVPLHQHDDLVQHVVKVHLDAAEPVKRKDIGLIRQVEEGSLEYPGQSLQYPRTLFQ